MKTETKAQVMHLRQGNPKIPSCALDASKRASLLFHVLDVPQRLGSWSLGLWRTWQDL